MDKSNQEILGETSEESYNWLRDHSDNAVEVARDETTNPRALIARRLQNAQEQAYNDKPSAKKKQRQMERLFESYREALLPIDKAELLGLELNSDVVEEAKKAGRRMKPYMSRYTFTNTIDTINKSLDKFMDDSD